MKRKQRSISRQTQKRKSALKLFFGIIATACLLVGGGIICCYAPSLVIYIGFALLLCLDLNPYDKGNINHRQKICKIECLLIVVAVIPLPIWVWFMWNNTGIAEILAVSGAYLLVLATFYCLFGKRWHGKTEFVSGNVFYEIDPANHYCDRIELRGIMRTRCDGAVIRITPEAGIVFETAWKKKQDSFPLCAFPETGEKCLVEALWTKDDREVVFFVNGEPLAAYCFYKTHTGCFLPAHRDRLIKTLDLKRWIPDSEKLQLLVQSVQKDIATQSIDRMPFNRGVFMLFFGAINIITLIIVRKSFSTLSFTVILLVCIFLILTGKNLIIKSNEMKKRKTENSSAKAGTEAKP